MDFGLQQHLITSDREWCITHPAALPNMLPDNKTNIIAKVHCQISKTVDQCVYNAHELLNSWVNLQVCDIKSNKKTKSREEEKTGKKNKKRKKRK